MSETHASKPDWAVGGRNYVLVLLTLTAAFNFVDRQILSVLLEPIGKEFNLPDTYLGLLSGIAFAAFYATLGIPIAVLADRSSRRNIIVATTAIFSVMTALCGAVTSFMQLFLVRVGVGVGEAGTAPASMSMLSDLYPVEERTAAMGFLGASGNIGLMLGLLVGGWVNEWYGWRTAFVVAAAPGLILTLLILYTVPEPVRRAPPPIRGRWIRSTGDSIAYLLSIRSFRRFALGGTLYGMAAYGIHTFMPLYYMRFHGMSTGEAGTVNAIIVGALGGFGAFGVGVLCSYLSRRDIRWNGWVPAVGILVSVPLLIAMLLTDNTWLAISLFVVPGILSSCHAGATWSIIQELVVPERRAVAASVYLLGYNLIGLGLGPFAVGLLSDLYIPLVGDQSLRWAMVTVLSIAFAGVFVYFMAARSVKADLERVRARRAA